MTEQQLPVQRISEGVLDTQALETEPLTGDIAPNGLPVTSAPAIGDIIYLPEVLKAGEMQRDFQHPALQDLAYRKSPVRIEQQPTSKSARKAVALLTRAQSLSIISNEPWLNPSILTHTLNGNRFCEMQYYSGDIWYIHPRLLIPKQMDGSSRSESTIRPDMISPVTQDIISGTCLFGASAVTAETENGTRFYLADANGSLEGIHSKFTTLHINHSIQPYEMETVMRLAGFLGNTFNHKQLNLTLHIPRLEYWLYALPLYEQGLMDKDLLQQWFAAVNQRSRKMQNFLTKVASSNAEVNFISPLESIEDRLQESINNDEKNLTPKFIEWLAGADPQWQSLLETSNLLAKRQETKGSGLRFKAIADFTIYDITYLSYVTAYAQALDRSNGLLIAVENPEEIRILEQGTQLIRTADEKKAILALYVHPNFFVPSESVLDGKRELFFFDDTESSVKGPQLVREIYAKSPKLPKSEVVFENI